MLIIKGVMFVVHFSPNISSPNIFSIHIFSLHQLINNLALLSSLVYKGKVDGTMARVLTTAAVHDTNVPQIYTFWSDFKTIYFLYLLSRHYLTFSPYPFLEDKRGLEHLGLVKMMSLWWIDHLVFWLILGFQNHW